MKPELDVWHHSLNVYDKVSNWYLKTCTKKSGKFSLAGSSQHIHNISVYQIWGIYIIFKAMNADNDFDL